MKKNSIKSATNNSKISQEKYLYMRSSIFIDDFHAGISNLQEIFKIAHTQIKPKAYTAPNVLDFGASKASKGKFYYLLQTPCPVSNLKSKNLLL